MNIYEIVLKRKEELFEKHNLDIRIKKSKIYDFKNSKKDNPCYKTIYNTKIYKDNYHYEIDAEIVQTELEAINIAIIYCEQNLIKV